MIPRVYNMNIVHVLPNMSEDNTKGTPRRAALRGRGRAIRPGAGERLYNTRKCVAVAVYMCDPIGGERRRAREHG